MKWINVKDKMPERGVDVLIFTTSKVVRLADRYSGQWRSIGNWFYDGKRWISTLKDDDVTHWMPLPAQPTEGEDAPSEQDELWDEVESIFDKHTSPTGGGYEADYTDRQSFLEELKQSFTITRKP